MQRFFLKYVRCCVSGREGWFVALPLCEDLFLISISRVVYELRMGISCCDGRPSALRAATPVDCGIIIRVRVSMQITVCHAATCSLLMLSVLGRN